MTEKEKRERVVKGLECCLDALVQSEHEFAENGIVMSSWQDRAKRIDAIREAIVLLKAQEPVEPVFNAMVETDMSYWVCGACGAFIYGNAYPHMAKDTMPKYCGYCGRAVKWE